MRYVLIIGLLISFACGKKVKPVSTTVDDRHTKTLVDKVALYTELSMEHTDRDSYGMFRLGGSVGDSILFSCLHQFATGEQVDALASFSPEGLPLRHPEITSSDSATPISKDMIVGFMLCAISSEDGEQLVSDILDAGTANGWDLCGDALEYNISAEDRIGRCLLSPGLVATLYRVREYLGGECNLACKAAQQVPTGLTKNVEGYRRHLSILHILVRGYTGGITYAELDILQHHADQQPHNALYQAALHKFLDGDQTRATELLLDTSKFPATALPTTDNYCTEYLYQRDQQSVGDWGPCESSVGVHPGIDFLMAGSLVL